MPNQIGQKPESGFNNPLGLLSDCHRRIEQFLKTIVKVCESADGASMLPFQITALEQALEYFRTSAPKHTADEEISLFPRLRRMPGGQAALDSMAALEIDHAAANRDHEQVDKFARKWLEMGFLTRQNVREMKQALERLSGMYARHIAIEDGELFPLAAQVLPAEALAAVGSEMAARRGLSALREPAPRAILKT
jgi:hemerythrin-like domain-containing protein